MDYVKCLQLIWQAIIKIWHIHNQHLHPSSHEQEDHSLLQAAVHQIFEEAQNNLALSPLIENLDPDRILSPPTCRIQQWVNNSDNHLHAHHQAIQLIAKLHTQDIRQFFPWTNSTQPPTAEDKNMLRPP